MSKKHYLEGGGILVSYSFSFSLQHYSHPRDLVLCAWELGAAIAQGERALPAKARNCVQ
jgi:hypothetical protein